MLSGSKQDRRKERDMSKKLGALVKDARAAKGLSQAALAGMVDGISAADVGKIERGEKEPAEAVVRQIAKALGVTQVSLVNAMTSAGKAASGKKTSSGKSSSANTSSKTSSSKTSSKKTSSKTQDAELKLTAAEKKLVQAYRKADSVTKKTAMNILEGNGSVSDILTTMIAGKSGGASKEVGDLLSQLLSGKGSASSSSSSSKEDAIGGLLGNLLGKVGK